MFRPLYVAYLMFGFVAAVGAASLVPGAEQASVCAAWHKASDVRLAAAENGLVPDAIRGCNPSE